MNNAVFVDQKTYEKITKEAPRILTLTVSTMVDKFKINGAVARRVLRDLLSKGLVRQCGDHNAHFTLYSGTQAKVQDKNLDPKEAAKLAAQEAAKEAKEAKDAAAKEAKEKK